MDRRLIVRVIGAVILVLAGSQSMYGPHISIHAQERPTVAPERPTIVPTEIAPTERPEERPEPTSTVLPQIENTIEPTAVPTIEAPTTLPSPTNIPAILPGTGETVQGIANSVVPLGLLLLIIGWLIGKRLKS